MWSNKAPKQTSAKDTKAQWRVHVRDELCVGRQPHCHQLALAHSPPSPVQSSPLPFPRGQNIAPPLFPFPPSPFHSPIPAAAAAAAAAQARASSSAGEGYSLTWDLEIC